MTHGPGAAAERAARASYGRLVALLAWRWRDLAAAEDAMSQALVRALERWPVDGVPRAPDAWLLTVARRELLQQARHERLAADPAVQVLFEDAHAGEPPQVPDERLRLLLACAHPAVPEGVRTPLMLQVVLGLEAARIASAMLLPPATLAQRLVRAKQAIQCSGASFEEAELREVPARLGAVLESIYGAYTIGARSGAIGDPKGLAGEAVYLARTVTALQPDAAEAWGLLALLLFCESRQDAQFDPGGRYVPLLEQDPARWSRDSIAEAEAALWRAASLRSPGPLQLEAAIQSAHSQRAATGRTPWSALLALYETLVAHHPSFGAHIGRAAALCASGDPASALACLDALPVSAIASHQPYWATRAHVLGALGRTALAAQARLRAIGLTEDPRVRDWLSARA